MGGPGGAGGQGRTEATERTEGTEMNIAMISGEIARRIPAMALDNPINNEATIANLIREEMGREPEAKPMNIGEAELIRRLGYDDGRSVQAQKKAAWLFCRRNNIRKLPGKVWPLRAVERAVNEDQQTARVNRMRKDCHEKAQKAQGS